MVSKMVKRIVSHIILTSYARRDIANCTFNKQRDFDFTRP